jgi:hypothetical protein
VPLTSRSDPFEPVTVCLAPEAKERFRGFFDQFAREQSLLSSDLAATWPKLRAHAARLALVIALFRWAQLDDAAPPETIDLESMEAGIELAEWFGEQARIVFTSTDGEANALQPSRVLRIIRNRGGLLTANELCRYDRAICSTADAEQILNRLACSGYGFWEMLRPSECGGRPTRRFVLRVDETI